MDELEESKKAPTNNIETDNKATKEFKIEEACLKHILFAMSLSGCYNPNKRKCYSRIYTIYRIFIFLALLAFAVKTASGFAYISKRDYFGHAILLGWNISIIITFLLTIRMNHSNFGSQECTFDFWNITILPQMMDLGIKFDQVGFKRKQLFLCLVAASIVSFVVLSGVLQLLGIFGDEHTATTTIPFERTPLTCLVQVLLLLICSLQVNIPTFYMIVICSMLNHCFHGFNKFLDTEMCHDAFLVPKNMQTIRQYYTNLCKAVVDFDNDFKYLLGNLFFCKIVSSLFILCVISRVHLDDIDIIGFMAYISWLFISMGTVLAMSVFAALVHDAAHAPLDSIYNINVQDITVEKFAQLYLFLSKLTGTQVGFSTCGLLIITKEFILTIAGVFLTYFAVLYTL